jgi:signal transduction histidine kinase
MLSASEPRMQHATTSLELLQTRERLLVGRRFLILRPKIVALGALGNAAMLALSGAPVLQKAVLAGALGATVLAFFAEALWLERRALSERWLLTSLALTLVVLAVGALASGGLGSPLLPLLFAPVVVGFAAFARTRPSALLFGIALCALLVLALAAPLPGFHAPPAPWSSHMLLISAAMSLALLAVGVIGLVDAHARIAASLERMRGDLLKEAERRAASVEHLGAQVAHEVKNPLTAVRGLVQLVLRKADDEKDRQRLSVVVSEVDRALEVLQGYLSFARPLSELSLGTVDARVLLEDVAGVVEARAYERNVRVELSGEGIALVVDRARMREALLNLALNALAAMPEGGVLALSCDMKDAMTARLCVVDTGAGMSAELLARIGHAFTSEAEGGTGLGVLMARSVARQHGGELFYASELGRGTAASIELPIS